MTSLMAEEVSYALCFDFYTSNNEAGYEALLAGLRLPVKMGAKKVTTLTDLRFAAIQITAEFEQRTKG